MSDRLNHLNSLMYHDPAVILRRIRLLERELVELQNTGVEIDPKVLSMRTNALRPYREWRDAAVFAFGMGIAKGVPIWYATEESSDYDFVTMWQQETTRHFCPVQLKELVPEALNPNLSLQRLLDGLGKYAPSPDTVVAVKINRLSGFALESAPAVPFSQLWFFWACAPESARWCLRGPFGDGHPPDPGVLTFDYPSA